METGLLLFYSVIFSVCRPIYIEVTLVVAVYGFLVASQSFACIYKSTSICGFTEMQLFSIEEQPCVNHFGSTKEQCVTCLYFRHTRAVHVRSSVYVFSDTVRYSDSWWLLLLSDAPGISRQDLIRDRQW